MGIRCDVCKNNVAGDDVIHVAPGTLKHIAIEHWGHRESQINVHLTTTLTVCSSCRDDGSLKNYAFNNNLLSRS